jgi:hypothetical protein
MKKEEAAKVIVGQTLEIVSFQRTPSRDFDFPLQEKMPVKILEIHTEESGYVHFHIGWILPLNSEPLKSLDTGEEIDGSQVYWMHPSRFELISDK